LRACGSGLRAGTIQAVLHAFCVMGYRLTTGEQVAQEHITVALLASHERGARSESSENT